MEPTRPHHARSRGSFPETQASFPGNERTGSQFERKIRPIETSSQGLNQACRVDREIGSADRREREKSEPEDPPTPEDPPDARRRRGGVSLRLPHPLPEDEARRGS